MAAFLIYAIFWLRKGRIVISPRFVIPNEVRDLLLVSRAAAMPLDPPKSD